VARNDRGIQNKLGLILHDKNTETNVLCANKINSKCIIFILFGVISIMLFEFN